MASGAVVGAASGHVPEDPVRGHVSESAPVGDDDLDAGMYLVKIETDRGLLTQRMSIE